MPDHASPSRRSFLKTSALALPALAAMGGRVLGANERLNVGCIGTGGRCRHLMKSLVKVPNVRITAICDVWDKHLDDARKLADPKAFATKQWRAILDRKDIDAVLIGTPDHWHVPMTIAACAAGKDVYVEKPLTHDLAEGKAVIEAQNKHRKIVQVGTQQRSMPHFAKGRELLKDGRIGKVFKVVMSWNRHTDRVRRHPLGVDAKTVDWKAFVGNAREQPFDEYRFRNWRWFWDFGGGLFTDLMVHWIDSAHWLLDLEHPLEARSIGQHVISKDVWETPDTVQTLLVYPGGLAAHFEGTFSNKRNRARLEIQGTDGTLYLDRGRLELIPDTDKVKAEELILGKGPRGLDFYDKPDGELLHLTNWVECVRSRKRPNASAEAGVSGASAAHLANQALRSGRVAAWASR